MERPPKDLNRPAEHSLDDLAASSHSSPIGEMDVAPGRSLNKLDLPPAVSGQAIARQLLALQRTHGNGYVQQLMAGHLGPPNPKLNPKNDGNAFRVSLEFERGAETFKVNARSLEDASRQLGARREFGEWKPFPLERKFHFDKHGKIRGVTIVAKDTILMPVWTGYGRAPPECKAEWDRMYAALTLHERRHRLIFLEVISHMAHEISQKDRKTLTAAGVDKIMRDRWPKNKENQDIYDDETKHGRTEGVFLDVPAACNPYM